MKKLLLFITALILLFACEKEDPIIEYTTTYEVTCDKPGFRFIYSLQNKTKNYFVEMDTIKNWQHTFTSFKDEEVMIYVNVSDTIERTITAKIIHNNNVIAENTEKGDTIIFSLLKVIP